MRALPIALLVLSVGCLTMKPPTTPPVPTNSYIRAPYDTVWQRVIGVFADARIPIQTLEKASGLIASTRFRLSPAQVKQWADCGTAPAYGGITVLEYYERNHMPIPDLLADFNVFVQPANDSTGVRVNLGLSSDAAARTPTTLTCVTNGKFEGALVNAIGGR